MASPDVEARLNHLEEEIARLKARLTRDEKPWWKKISGTFKDDPLHAEAMKLGRAERRRLGSPARSSRKNGRARHRPA